MSHGDFKARREAVRPILIALNMRPKTGPLQAAEYLQRLAQKERRTLYGKKRGAMFAMPNWTSSALYWALAPLTADELENARAEIERAEGAGVKIITWTDKEYPKPLRFSEAPPSVLYVKGTLLPQDEKAIAIVGSRKALKEYMELAADIAYGLAKRGFTIISGLARGVDRYAHEGALDAGGRTLAVLGSGVDVVYPAEHAGLAERIESQGALVSFYPIGAKPQPHHFPARNWVIAGLSCAVVVVQGTHRGGAIITANAAAAMGREVMAVPGPIGHPLSEGTHGLIHDGARLVTSAEEVIAALESSETAPTPQMEAYLARHEALASGRREPEVEAASLPLPFPDDSPEARIMDQIGRGTKTVEELAAACGLAIGQTQAALTRLEIQGRVVAVDAGRYRVARRGQSGQAFLRL